MISPDLVALKRRVLKAEAEYQYWAAANTSGLSAETLVKLEVWYRQAARDLSEARAAYDKALAETADD